MLKIFTKFIPSFRAYNNKITNFSNFYQQTYTRFSFRRAIVPTMLATGYALYSPYYVGMKDNDKKD